MGFEKLKKAGRGGGNTEPMISLRQSGSIGINREALDEFFEGAEGIVLHYDSEENKLGLEPVEDVDEDEDAYTLSRSDSGGSVTPSAKLKEHDLVPEEVSKQYRPELVETDEVEELVVIDVDDHFRTYGTPESQDEEDTSEATADD